MRPPSAPVPAEPGPVILVDDDGAVLDALAFALRLEGITVRPYGDAALLLRDDDIPQVGCIVLDYQMPLMNGIDLLEHLRDRHVDLPAILIAGKITQERRNRAWRAGFVAVLEKPLEDSSLLESTRRALFRG